MSIYVYIAVMAVTTYLIRAIPLTLMKKPIRNRFLRSFLHYVPTACLTAMTFPAILYATENVISGVVGLAVGVALAFWKKSLIVVAVASCAAVFLTEQLIRFLPPLLPYREYSRSHRQVQIYHRAFRDPTVQN